MRTWTRDPHSGGVKIPKALQDATEARLLVHAESHYAATCSRLEVRFRSEFCNINAYQEPDAGVNRVRSNVIESTDVVYDAHS